MKPTIVFMLGVSYGKLYLLVVSLYNSHKFNSYGRLINVKIAQLDVFNVTLDTFEDVLFDCFFFFCICPVLQLQA